MGKLTEKKLSNLGIVKTWKKSIYWCDTTFSNIHVDLAGTDKDLLEVIFNEGMSQGIEKGKQIRSKEFKTLINDTD